MVVCSAVAAGDVCVAVQAAGATDGRHAAESPKSAQRELTQQNEKTTITQPAALQASTLHQHTLMCMIEQVLLLFDLVYFKTGDQ
jgi:hypothetical protein